MKRRRVHRAKIKCFTLIEVLIAVAVIVLSLVAIIGLMNISLMSGKQVQDETEVEAIPGALQNFLQTAGFNTCFSYVQTDPGIYAYALPTNGSMIIINTNGAPSLATDVLKRSGRLFRIYLSPSSDAMIRLTTNAPETLEECSSNLVSGLAPNSYSDAYLPIQVTVYSVPVLNFTQTNAYSYPAITYDTVISR